MPPRHFDISCFGSLLLATHRAYLLAARSAFLAYFIPVGYGLFVILQVGVRCATCNNNVLSSSAQPIADIQRTLRWVPCSFLSVLRIVDAPRLIALAVVGSTAPQDETTAEVGAFRHVSAVCFCGSILMRGTGRVSRRLCTTTEVPSRNPWRSTPQLSLFWWRATTRS